MRAVYKYYIINPKKGGANRLFLPLGFKTLCLQKQGDVPCLWMLVDPQETETLNVQLHIVGTGQSRVPIKSAYPWVYLDTYQDGPRVWHVFYEVVPETVEPDKKKIGLYDKYDVVRTDGGCALGEKHERCSHFVLDLNHDAHYAIPALRSYANACREELPILSRDLVAVADAMERGEFKDIRDFMPGSVGPADDGDGS